MRKIFFLLIGIAFTCIGTAQSIMELMERNDLPLTEIERRAKLHFEREGTGRGTMYKQFQRWLYERKFHVDENGFFISPHTEWNNYLVNRGSLRTESVTTASWTPIGPSGWTYTSGWNPGTGRISAMAIHPLNENIIYVGSPGGGVWKSTNAGASWTGLTDDNNLWMSVYSLAIDPLNQNTVYAGMNNGVIIKSTNAGTSFTTLGTGPSGLVRKILIHPTNSSIVFACATNGIFRSTNGGTSWSQVHTGNKEDIEFKPNDPNIMYASGPSAATNLVRSVDNGVTWTVLGVVQGITNSGRTLVAVSAANPNVVYVAQANANEFGRMYKSFDAGLSFITTVIGDAASFTNFFGYPADGSGSGGQAAYDMGMDVSATNADEVYIGGIICWRSVNGGTTFTAITEWFYPNSTGYNHADIHGLFSINGNLYSISDGGIYKSTNNGDTWTDLSIGLTIRQFYRIANSQSNATVITGGAQDNGSVTRQSAGNWVDWLGADGMEGLVSPTNHLNIWGTSQNGVIYKSINGGNSRINLAKPSDGNWVTPLVIHPANENIIYGGWTGVWKSINGGTTWSNISTGVINEKLIDLTLAPSAPTTIYAVGANSLYVSTNDGTNWTTHTIPGSITDIAVDPNDPSKIWIATLNTTTPIMVSTNGGASFTNVPGLPALAARTVVVDDNTPTGIYVGMNIGVYYKQETDLAWSDYSLNLPKVAINELEIQKAAGKIRVATYGRSIWESPVAMPGLPDLTNSQFFSSVQITSGNVIDEVITVRNVGSGPTTAPITFSFTNYSPLSGLTLTSNTAATVVIGIDTYILDNANWIFDPVMGTFTSSPGVVIAPGTSRSIGIRIARNGGANGSVTQTATVAAGTGGGDATLLNNSISNTILKL